MKNKPMIFLLYGANGYTGQLIARFAKEYGLKPVLAGRSEDKVKPLAKSLGYPWKVFDLEETEKLDEALREVKVVLHAAGPFIHTAQPMMEACLRTGTHYLDITGEMAIFEMAFRLSQKAKDANIMLLPGSGFDVVPSDCLALHMKERLPDATHLRLAFANVGGSVSHGTALTAIENLGKPGAVRKDGKITAVPIAYKSLWFPADGKRLFAMTIPWGDVSTAFHSTGIPNIEVYMAVPPSTYRLAKWGRYFGWLMRTEFVKNYFRRRIKKRPAGPSDSRRERAKSCFWGEVANAEGVARQATLTTPEGYTLTAKTSLVILKRVLAGDFKTGFQTPAKAYGKDLIMEIEGVKREDLE